MYHRLVKDMDDPRVAAGALAKAALLLATEPLDKVTGRVTYSSRPERVGWIDEARGRGAQTRGSGYSEI